MFSLLSVDVPSLSMAKIVFFPFFLVFSYVKCVYRNTASDFKMCLHPNLLFFFLVVAQRGRNALSIAMQGSHADTAALLQAHAKARAV